MNRIPMVTLLAMGVRLLGLPIAEQLRRCDISGLGGLEEDSASSPPAGGSFGVGGCGSGCRVVQPLSYDVLEGRRASWRGIWHQRI